MIDLRECDVPRLSAKRIRRKLLTGIGKGLVMSRQAWMEVET